MNDLYMRGESPPSPMKVFLDMDGVIADFNRAAHEAHEREDTYLCPHNLGRYNFDEIWNMSASDFWRPLNGRHFWSAIHPTPEAVEIVDQLSSKFGLDNIAVLTAPAMSEYCIPGKRTWINHHFPQLHNQLIFASPVTKQFFAHSKALLVDDRDSNVEEFCYAGGRAILIPRAWNTQYHFRNHVVDYLKSELESL